MLQIQYKNSEKRPLWLVDAKYTIGSDTACEIPVDDTTIAARQAEMEVSQDSVLLRNLGEAGLVSVNGESVSGERQLAHGDELTVGSQIFSLVDPKQGRQPVTAQSEAPTALSSSGWSLKATNTALANRSFPIEREVVVGRSNECDITLGVAHLSRRHARLKFSGENLEVEDLRSSNGTYVNGKQVQRAVLRDGDELSFDTLTFQVNGPQDDSESTMLRPQADMDKTNVRPAINVNEPKAAPKPRPARPTASKKVNNPNATQPLPKVEETSESSKMNGLVIGGVVVALIAVVYFFFLS